MVNVIKIPVDIIESEDSYTVIADLPGVEKSSIHITGSEDSISIKAIRQDSGVLSGKYILMERTKGIMSRTIKFKKFINLSKARAKYENGILIVNLPKAQDEFIIDTYFKIVIF